MSYTYRLYSLKEIQAARRSPLSFPDKSLPASHRSTSFNRSANLSSVYRPLGVTFGTGFLDDFFFISRG